MLPFGFAVERSSGTGSYSVLLQFLLWGSASEPSWAVLASPPGTDSALLETFLPGLS